MKEMHDPLPPLPPTGGFFHAPILLKENWTFRGRARALGAHVRKGKLGGSGCLFGLGFTEMSGKVPAGIVVVIGI